MPTIMLRWLAYPGTMVAAFATHETLLRVSVPTAYSAYGAAVLAAALVVFFEHVLPYDPTWRPHRAEATTDLIFMVTVQMVLPQILGLVAALTILAALDPYLLPVMRAWPHEWSLPGQVAAMMIGAELLRYPLHVAAHNTKHLWRLHAVHHSSKRLYWLNVGRFHPLEKSLQYLLDTLPFIFFGVGPDVVALYFVFYAVNGFYQHSNVDVRYGPLNYLVSGPELHRWHHSRVIQESNHNYGNNLIVWDLLFGTWFLPRNLRVGELGLLNPSYPQRFVAQMFAPLTPGLDKRAGTDDH